jgi:hypothetical protein
LGDVAEERCRRSVDAFNPGPRVLAVAVPRLTMTAKPSELSIRERHGAHAHAGSVIIRARRPASAQTSQAEDSVGPLAGVGGVRGADRLLEFVHELARHPDSVDVDGVIHPVSLATCRH